MDKPSQVHPLFHLSYCPWCGPPLLLFSATRTGQHPTESSNACTNFVLTKRKSSDVTIHRARCTGLPRPVPTLEEEVTTWEPAIHNPEPSHHLLSSPPLLLHRTSTPAGKLARNSRRRHGREPFKLWTSSDQAMAWM